MAIPLAMDPELTLTVELVRRAKGGSDEALNRLFERYYDRVRRIVRLRLGPGLRSRVESGDILQETFAAAIDAFDNFEMRHEAGFINWMSKIAERQVLAAADYHGAQKRDTAREVPLASGDASHSIHNDPADDAPLPAEALARAEDTAKVESAIAQLPEEHRELIIWRNYAGASWDVVARETGRPSPDAARMMHSKAMIALGRLMREQEG